LSVAGASAGAAGVSAGAAGASAGAAGASAGASGVAGVVAAAAESVVVVSVSLAVLLQAVKANAAIAITNNFFIFFYFIIKIGCKFIDILLNKKLGTHKISTNCTVFTTLFVWNTFHDRSVSDISFLSLVL
jgi:hypothetical protein